MQRTISLWEVKQIKRHPANHQDPDFQIALPLRYLSRVFAAVTFRAEFDKCVDMGHQRRYLSQISKPLILSSFCIKVSLFDKKLFDVNICLCDILQTQLNYICGSTQLVLRYSLERPHTRVGFHVWFRLRVGNML